MMARRQPWHLLLGLAAGLSIFSSACSQQPGFSFAQQDGAKTFGCYTEKPASMFEAEFADGDVMVADNGKRITLHFSPSIWPRAEDRYEGEGYVLTFDPEAFLTRPDGSTRGPCH